MRPIPSVHLVPAALAALAAAGCQEPPPASAWVPPPNMPEKPPVLRCCRRITPISPTLSRI